MAAYSLVWKRSAAKELGTWPREVVSRIIALVEALRVDPYPAGARKLAGAERTFRLRSGNYRLVYTNVRSKVNK